MSPRQTNAGPEEALLRSTEPKIPTGWSGDGRFLLYNNTDPRPATTSGFCRLRREGPAANV